MRRTLTLALALIFWGAAAPIASVTAQDPGVTVYLELQDGSTGDALTDSCFVLENASNEGCDENDDGRIRFEAIAPDTYTVRQTRASEGFLPIGDFTIDVNPEEREQSFFVATFPDTASAATADVVLDLVDVESGDPVHGGCFTFEGGSEEGCDENGDGVVAFDDMTVGAYRVRNTVPPEGYEPAPERWIGVNGDRTFPIELTASGSNSEPNDGSSDIALITRDPETSALVKGTCYVLVDFSNEGCDENGDGRVTFEDVPAGLYDVRQTTTPDGYPTPDDFRILVDGRYPAQGLVVRQSETQNKRGQRNVSILIRDDASGELITDSGICVRIGDYSREGCDDNRDGQIDFLDIPFGTYDVVVTRGPERGTLNGEPFSIDVRESESSVIIDEVTIDRSRS
jgi:uncharacterized surface anchored protein